MYGADDAAVLEFSERQPRRYRMEQRHGEARTQLLRKVVRARSRAHLRFDIESLSHEQRMVGWRATLRAQPKE
jgi:hypothetical protein